MSELATLIADLRAAGITVRADGDELIVRAPKGAMTAPLAAALRASKADLLAFLQKAHESRERQASRVVPADPELRGGLCEAQQRLWFLYQLEGPSPTYNMPLVVRIRGELDGDRLEAALQGIAARHETLRTRFVERASQPLAVIDADPQLVLDRSALESSDLTPAEQIQCASDAASSICFDLANDHLIRARLIELSDASHLLLVTFHHIICDGWSLTNFIAELSWTYEAPGEQPPALEVQYADYVCWAASQRERSESDIHWWREYLSGAPDHTPLPMDFSRQATPSYAGEELSLALPSDTFAAVEDLARARGATTYMVLLAAFSLLIQRLSGEQESDDLVIGSTVANRDLPELEPLIGLFTNMLPLRLAPATCVTVSQLIDLIKSQYLAAHAHRNVAFERIVETLNPPRVLNRSPIFQIVFDLQNHPDVELKLGNCEFEPVAPPVQHAKFDLSVSVEANAGESKLHCVWNSDVLTRDTVESWMLGYLEVLRGFSEGLEQPLESIRSTPRVLADRWLEQQQQSFTEAPEQSWLEVFDALALKIPDRRAVSCGERSLSYAGLRQRARSIAADLLQRQVQPGDRVLVLLDRHSELLAALLAVHYAGAVYVPVDPGYPEERLRWVLEDAAPSIVLTEMAYQHLPALEAFATATVESIEPLTTEVSLPGPQFADLAYIIFTSGSTGRPKGVQIEHGALSNFLQSMALQPGLAPEDVLLAVTTVSFDIAALELLLPLMVGAELVIADRLTAVDGRALRAAMKQHAITCLQATPSTWRLLIDAGWREGKGLKALCGGEALPVSLARAVCDTGAELWNMYGPTETTIWSAVRRVDSLTECRPSASGNEAIGFGIDNTALYVLDHRGELVAAGAVGELWIGGSGLARGYWQRPGQTAERYRPDPFSKIPGARMYGTGDLVRARVDGQIDFLGRIDNQVKLRGFRIELGEIESALLKLPGVSAAVAMAVGEELETRHLVAFVHATDGQLGDAGIDLKAVLRESLPAYMVPSRVVSLDFLPMTPNGKVDRRALASQASSREEKRAAVRAEGHLQRTIADIWSAELYVDNPDVDTNIFELGAHSLMLAKVQRELEQALARSIDLIELFRHPTIRSLSLHLEQHPEKYQDSPGLADRSGSRDKAQLESADVAVIGLAGQFPGAANIEDFWELIISGSSGIQRFSEEALRKAGIEVELLASPDFVPVHGAIDDIELFDAEYFGLRPSEARLMDPQHRLFLQTAVHALENAGYAGFDQAQNVGVYGGCGQNDYLLDHVLPFLDRNADQDAYDSIIGSEKDFLTTRVSYLLNLTGPSLDIQTACSTGLVAVHVACQALRQGECDMALAGAVAIRVPQANGHLYQEGSIVSPDGDCRPFDENAAGTVWGSGVGTLVLKPMDRAAADGDQILAVIKGSAINNDGSSKVGFTAPSVDGQAAVIRGALQNAGVEPRQLRMIETHGTATALGDLIEYGALKDVFRDCEAPCYLGAVKSQIGHLNSAAGVAGLIKAILAIQHGRIPKLHGFQNPNARLDTSGVALTWPQEPVEWPEEEGARIAGVSSFGIGGTNAHLVVAGAAGLEEVAAQPARPQILALSANSEQALADLRQQAGQLWMERGGDVNSLAWTLANGAVHRRYRLAVVSEDIAIAGDILANNKFQTASGAAVGEIFKTAFLYSGQGTQSLGMAADLYRRYAVFRVALDEVAALVQERLAVDIVELLCEQQDPPGQQALAARLSETRITQPALFAVQFALTRLWQAWGIRAHKVMGHSLGELSAAFTAGVFDLTTAIDVVCHRAELCWQQPAGAMLAAAAPASRVTPLIGADIDIAAINAPNATVLSGPPAAIAQLEQVLQAADINCKKLHVSHAFHSRQMAQAQIDFEAFLDTKTLNPPTIPMVSSVHGGWLTDQEATSAAYWADQLTTTVQFERGLTCLAEDKQLKFLEIGPGQVLTELARASLDSPPRAVAGTVSERGMLSAAADLWCHGLPVQLSACCGDEPELRRRVALPSYPFRRERHWIEKGRRDHHPPRLALEDWFFIPSWRPAPWARSAGSAICWHIEEGTAEPPSRLGQVLHWHSGWDLPALASSPDSTGVLLLAEEGWAEHPCQRITGLLGAWTQAYPGKPLRIRILTRQLLTVFPGERPDAETAALRGVLPVIAQEYPSIDIRCIDSDTADYGEVEARAIAAEMGSAETPQFVAFRRGQRYLPDAAPVKLPVADKPPQCLREGGAYLVTGGSGRIGRSIARYLVERCHARVILTSRTAPAAMPDDIQASIEWISADIGDEVQVDQLFAQLSARDIEIAGVFHAAGDPSHSVPIQDCPRHWPWPVLRPKLDGARHMARHINGHMDFCVLMSSLSSLYGGLGYLEYAAANATLDALAWELNATAGTAWISVNWDAWRFDDAQPSAWINAVEGIEALDRILANLPLQQVMVSTQSPESRLRQPVLTPAAEPNLGRVEAGEGMSTTQATIAAVWGQLLGHAAIGLDDDYFALGGDSMLAIRIVESLRVRLNRPVHLSALVQNPSIRSLAAAIESSLNEELSILVPMAQGSRAQRVLLMPGTGGSVTYLAPLARHLGDAGYSVMGLQAAGLDAMTPARASIEDIAADNLAALKLRDDEDVILIGHSLGSWVGLEMARQLSTEKRRVPQLFVLDTARPATRENNAMQHWSDADWMTSITENVTQAWGLQVQADKRELDGLVWSDMIAWLHGQLVTGGVLPAESDTRLVAGIASVFRTQALISYAPPIEPVADITLIRAADSLDEYLEGVPQSIVSDTAWGWGEFSITDVALRATPGNHLSMVSPLNAAALTSVIQQSFHTSAVVVHEQ
ncbi:MAG: amino acid adenylation domain-containing protein [Congregibacter sp.]